VKPVTVGGGVAGRHLPPEIARGAGDHHHDFDAIGRLARVDWHVPSTAACARNTCGHKTGTRPRHLPASSGGGLSGPLEALLKLKLEPMVAAALVAAASGVVSAPLTAPLGLPERRGLASDFWLGGDPRSSPIGARTAARVGANRAPAKPRWQTLRSAALGFFGPVDALRLGRGRALGLEHQT